MKKIALLLAAMAASGCTVSSGKYFEYEDANKVTNGMTRDQVIATMKETPYQVKDDTMTWSWAKANWLTGSHENRAVKFSFDNDGKTYGIEPGGPFKNITPYLDD
jgi:hypothetical protein